jgi:hypothetical protein
MTFWLEHLQLFDVRNFDSSFNINIRYGYTVTPGFGRQTECEPCTWQDHKLTYTAIT